MRVQFSVLCRDLDRHRSDSMTIAKHDLDAMTSPRQLECARRVPSLAPIDHHLPPLCTRAPDA
jgi:hypothetical protein